MQTQQKIQPSGIEVPLKTSHAAEYPFYFFFTTVGKSFLQFSISRRIFFRDDHSDSWEISMNQHYIFFWKDHLLSPFMVHFIFFYSNLSFVFVCFYFFFKLAVVKTVNVLIYFSSWIFLFSFYFLVLEFFFSFFSFLLFFLYFCSIFKILYFRCLVYFRFIFLLFLFNF